MKDIQSLFPILCALLLSAACHSQQVADVPDGLDELVDELCQPSSEGLTPGTAIAVVKDGQVLINKGYGYANLDYEIPITTDSRFDLASVSKQFAGYAISKLIEDGKIALTDDIREYIPELHDFDQTITIDHLLHHTSGIRDWASSMPLAGRSFEDVISCDQILRMAFQQRALNFAPGEEYSYTNTGYNLLAELVERVTGKSFRVWTQENIFEPLNMESSLFLDNHNETIPQRVTGYYWRGNGYQASPNTLTALGSSSMYSTTSDMVKWANFLQEGIDEGDPVVLRMLTQGVLNSGEEIDYAFGVSVSEFNGTRWISHSGSWASFQTYIAFLPDYDLSIVVLNNFPKHGRPTAQEIAALFVPSPPESGESEEEPAIVSLTADVLEPYVGTYKLGDGWYVHITMEDGQLWTEATDEDKFPMEALSDSVFKVPAYGNREMSFHRDGAGRVTHLVYMGAERPKMTNPFEYDPETASDYAGKYYSPELNTHLSMVIKDDELKMWHYDYGDIALIPAWTDDFRGEHWWMSSVVFQRDRSGNVTGFHASSGRSRNQWFEKVE